MRLSQLFFKTVSSRKGWVETPLYWKDKEFRNSPVCVIARVHNKKEIQIWNSIVIQAYLYLECTICNRVPNKGILMAVCFPCSLLLSLSLIYNADLPLHTRTSHTPSFMSICQMQNLVSGCTQAIDEHLLVMTAKLFLT